MTNAEKTVRAKLSILRDPVYRAFQQRLLPTLPPESILGVRTPALRAYAKELRGTATAEKFLSVLPHTFYEENALHACLLEGIPDFARAMELTERFLPYLDNWAVCDQYCPKVFRKHPDELYAAICLWLRSDRVYTVRYGLVRLMSFYLDAPLYRPQVLELAASVISSEYYVRMAVAWLFSFALIKQYDDALPYLTSRRLDVWTHNKAIRKAIESYRVPVSVKEYLRTLTVCETKGESVR